jgi:LuxR family transcriptional regulator, maltose regulon positive regulatory protein
MAGPRHATPVTRRQGAQPAETQPPLIAPPPPLEPASIPTVATKLGVPRTPLHVLERKRLLDALDRGVENRLTLLSAPAGAGKTMLLASWIQSRRLPGPCSWLSLDEDDNDASRLLADLLSALRSSRTVGGSRALARLTPPPGARTERFLPSLVNALAKLSSPIVVVLDDVHELTSPQAVGALDFLVRHAPPQCRLVLAGRVDPPLGIERLRLSEGLAELRMADLAFDRAETATFCARLALGLSDPDVDLLWTRTEGWAAALRLAALSLRENREPERFLSELAGTDRAIADYLLSEVLDRTPERSREFMLRTCVVDTINPQLAEALTGVHGGASTLADLEGLGMPLHPTPSVGGGSHDWYRYHPLFRELLKAHLQYAHASEVPYLHRRAANWYAEHGQTMPAIRHALTGEDWERAGALVAENWLSLFLLGRSAAMRTAIVQLPPEVITGDPRLAAAFAGSRLESGDLVDARRHLALAREARKEVSEQARPELELTLAAVALCESRSRLHVADAERHARRLARLARGAAPSWSLLHSFAQANLGATYLWSGDRAAAVDPLREALALATEHGHELIAVDCMAQLAIEYLLRGELTRADELASPAIELAEQRGWCDGPGVASAYLAAGAGAYQRAEFELAEGLLRHGETAAETAGPFIAPAVGLAQVMALAAAGPRSAARGALKLRAIAAALDDAGSTGALRAALAYTKLRVLLAAGDQEAARDAAASSRKQALKRPELLVARARVELSEGELDRAGDSLEQVLQTRMGNDDRDGSAERSEVHPAMLAEAWLLLALVEHERGHRELAAANLEEALAVADEEPFRDAFLLNGAATGALLERQAQTASSHPDLLEALLNGFDGKRAGRAPLAEPLTDRELCILRYLPTMLSNAEIGAEIFVSLNTVKTHLRGIYRKLDASGRADAVEKARAAGLLSAGIRRRRAPATPRRSR